MDGLLQEFEADLARLRTGCEGRPGKELLRLLLLALEREQMVTVAYRDRLIADRLARTSLPEGVRSLIRHALVWVWRDEEMHAVFIRGWLLGGSPAAVRLRARLQMLNGTLGGWASSIRLHVPWSRAPLLRAAATALQWMGIVAGKVPRQVRRELDYQPFRRFCEFNVHAERTAALCWSRIIEVAASVPGVTPEVRQEFRRMQKDEEDHARVFDAIGSVLGTDDRLLAGAGEDGLREAIRAVGEDFLPRAERGASREDHPLGTGGRVVVRSGGDRLELFRRTLDDAGLPRVLSRRRPGFRAAVKTTFMLAYHRRDRSTHVDPVLADALAAYLREHGAGDVALCEGRNIYDRFYGGRSVAEVARYAGFTSERYRVVDLSDELAEHRFGRGMAQYGVGRTWKEADVRIAFGKMKSHPIDVFTLSLSVLEGLGSRSDAFIFSERRMSRASAIMSIVSDFPPHFAVVDAYAHVPDGVLGMMQGVRTRMPGRFYAGEDAVAVDLVAGRHLGGIDPRASATVREACHWFGDPSGRATVDGPDERIPGWRGPFRNDLTAGLSAFSLPFYEYFTGRGACFVPEMDERAFPPRGGEGLPLRLARRAFQTLLILRHMK